jgi:Rrf2 family transcriptional regulator, cysteine metabolism repressor
MKVSTRARYGTRAMIDIAIHADRGHTMLKNIAERQGISAKYLDHILSSLRRAGLIKNIRGREGGYMLARPASAITLKNIFDAVEGPFIPVDCLENELLCDHLAVCPTREVWLRMKHAVEDVLAGTTLQELTERRDTKNAELLHYSI